MTDDTGTQAAEFQTQARQHRNGIWWVASYPKSGNTWARLFANCAVTRFPANINAAYQYACGDNAAQFVQACSAMPLSQMGMREAIYLRPAALINKLAMDTPRDCCLKTHHANLACDEIPLIPPKLSKGAVYIVRDPRDVAVSFAKHMGVEVDHAIGLMGCGNTIIHHHKIPIFHYLSDWSTHVKSWLDEDNPVPTSCIRYEAMLSDPERTFWNIIDSIGLRDYVTADAFEFAMRETQFDRLHDQEDQTGFRETGRKQDRFFNAGCAGRWRDVLTKDQVSQIESDHGEVMDELGYELTTTCVGV